MRPAPSTFPVTTAGATDRERCPAAGSNVVLGGQTLTLSNASTTYTVWIMTALAAG